MMDYFEYSQERKAEISGNREMTRNLRDHFSGGRRLPGDLRGGTNNRHFSVGQLENGLYAAIREPIMKVERCQEENKRELEMYCSDAEDMAKEYKVVGIQNIIHDREKCGESAWLASSFAIGVKFKFFDYWRYALIIEDLTAGGSVKYVRGLGEDSGVTEGGHEVVFDLGGISDFSSSRGYMLDENMIIFDKD